MLTHAAKTRTERGVAGRRVVQGMLSVLTALCCLMAFGTTAQAQTVAVNWHNFNDLGVPASGGTALQCVTGTNLYITDTTNTSDETATGGIDVLEIPERPDMGKCFFLRSGQSAGSFSVRYNNAGYTIEGKAFDIVLECQVQAKGVAKFRSMVYAPKGRNTKVGDRGTKDDTTSAHTQGLRMVFKMHFYERGTDTKLMVRGQEPAFALVVKDMDVRDGTVDRSTDTDTSGRSNYNSASFNGEYSEGIEFIGNFGNEVHLIRNMSIAQHSTDGSKPGHPLGAGTKNDNTWVHASHECGVNDAADASLAILAYDGAEFAWCGAQGYWDNWWANTNNYPDSCWTLGTPRAANATFYAGMGSSLGFNALTDEYPGIDDPVKAPDTQDAQLGDTVTWTVTQTFPYVASANQPNSIAISDTLDAAFDASQATITVQKGDTGEEVDATENWNVAVSGQTVTATAVSTAHGYAEGRHVFTITAPLRSDANLGAYPLEGGKRIVKNTAHTLIDVKTGTDIDKTTNEVDVRVGADPLLTISKSANPTSIANPTANRSTVTWTALIKNEGKETITNITPTDALLTARTITPTIDKTTLAPGETATLTAEMPVSQGDIDAGQVTNAITATGRDTITGEAVNTGEATAQVTLGRTAALGIEKTASVETIGIGGSIGYTIKVTNNGNVTLSDITITDEKLGIDGTHVADTLAPGASVTRNDLSYGPVSEADAAAGSVHNVASAHGTPPTGVDQPADPTDDATVTVTHTSGLEITKTVTPTSLPDTTKAGTTVTWNFKVKNNGDVTVSNVAVSDPLLSGRRITVSLAKTTLAPGEETTGTASMTLTQADINAGYVINTATATGTDATNGDDVASNESTARVDVARKAQLAIDKTAGVPSASIGDRIGYTIEVTNTGNVTLTDVTITDAKLGIRGLTVADTLEPDASVTKSTGLTYGPVTEADALAGSVTNTASAHGTPPTGVEQPADPQDSATVNVGHTASILIEKTTPEATLPGTTKAGDTVAWNFKVTNNGDVSLSNIAVTDALLAGRRLSVTLDKAGLAPGEAATGTVSMPLTQDDIDAGYVVNTAKATGTDIATQATIESDEDTARVDIERAPALTIQKDVTEESVAIGGTAHYAITVKNTGNVTLAPVTITDEKLGITGRQISERLLPGETATDRTLSYGPVTTQDAAASPIQNVASAHGTPPEGVNPPDDPTDDATFAVTHTSKLLIEKTTPTETLPANTQAGTSVTWNFEVTNQGDVTIEGISVIDPLVTGRQGEVTLDKTTLAPGETATATAQTLLTSGDIDAGKLVNTAKATGTDSISGTPVESDEDTAQVNIPRNPAITIVKQAGTETAAVGDTIEYAIQVTNTGNVTLTNVTITDQKLGITDMPIATSLAPGGTATKEGLTYGPLTEADAAASPVRNVASAHGDPPEGMDPFEDPTDDAEVDVTHTCSLAIQKSTPNATLPDTTQAGDEVTWSFEVTNTGNATVKDISVSDPLLAGRNVTVTLSKTTLAPNEIATATASMPLTQADIDAGRVMNTAKATGTDSIDDSAVESDEDAAQVDIARKPVLTIKKDASPMTVQIGQTVSYQITVANTGNVTLTDVTVSDTKLGILRRKVADALAPGEVAPVATGSYGPVTEADAIAGKIDNVASAHATPPEGVDPPADPTDEASVTVTHTKGIAIAKTTPQPTLPDTTKAGDMVTWTFAITNTGDVTLSNVSVNDPLLAGRNIAVSLPQRTIAPGKTIEASVQMELTQADIDAGHVENTAKATGVPSTSPDPIESPEDSAEVDILRRADLAIRKTPATEQGSIGGTIEFELEVENTGNVTLTDVTVTDELTGDAAVKVADTLPPGGTARKPVSYGPVSEADAVARKVDNLATAHGNPPEGVTPPADPTGEASVPVVANPSLEVEKTADAEVIDGAKVGDEVVWTIVVRNTGDMTLDDVRLNDSMLSERKVSVELDKTKLAPGEQTTLTAKTKVTQDDIDLNSVANMAFATATDPLLVPGADPRLIVSNEDTAKVELRSSPDMRVEKSVTPTQAKPGDTITWKVTATNTGNVTLMDVTVDDDLVGVAGQKIADMLPPGQTATAEFKYKVTEADLRDGSRKNVALVTALWGIGSPERIERKCEATVTVARAAAQSASGKKSDLVQTGETLAATALGIIAAAAGALVAVRNARRRA